MPAVTGSGRQPADARAPDTSRQLDVSIDAPECDGHPMSVIRGPSDDLAQMEAGPASVTEPIGEVQQVHSGIVERP